MEKCKKVQKSDGKVNKKCKKVQGHGEKKKILSAEKSCKEMPTAFNVCLRLLWAMNGCVSDVEHERTDTTTGKPESTIFLCKCSRREACCL